MNDKQLLQMLEVLGKNSRIARSSKSLAASDSVKARDQECAATIKKIITSNDNNLSTRNLAAAAHSPSRNVNKASVLTQFIFRNGKL